MSFSHHFVSVVCHPLNTNEKPSLILGKVSGHNFGRGAFKEYHIKVWFNLTRWFLRRSKCENFSYIGKGVLE
jgi:hypothetical protein